MNYNITINLGALMHKMAEVEGKQCICLPIMENDLDIKQLDNGAEVVTLRACAFTVDEPRHNESHTVKQALPKMAGGSNFAEKPKMPYLGWMYEMVKREEQPNRTW